MTELKLALSQGDLSSFMSQLQDGVRVEIEFGTNINDVLCRQLGVAPEYVENRIQTIFLDGKAVDDLEKTVIKEGSVLSLSAAMPGLVGATMRRGGYYACFRGQITHKELGHESPVGRGLLKIKLFNLLLRELGPLLLKKGIWMTPAEMKIWLSASNLVLERLEVVRLNDKNIPVAELAVCEWLPKEGFICLGVDFQG